MKLVDFNKQCNNNYSTACRSKKELLMMIIGQALKEEQNRLGLTEEEMAQGVLSKSAYSRVINNKRNISSDLLIRLLFKNNIDIENFFSEIEDTYLPESIKLENKLSYEMAEAVNNHKKEKVRACYQKIMKANVNIFLKKRAKIALAFFENNLEKLDWNFKKSILNDLSSYENWVFNAQAIRLFGSAISILPSENVESEMSFFFKKISRVTKLSSIMQERYATICDNYLHWKYNYINNPRDLKIEGNIKKSLDYLNNLPSMPRTIIYIISAQYYSALFTKNIKRAKHIKKELLNMGCNLVVKNWPI